MQVGKLKKGQAEVVGALAIAILTALSVYATAYSIQLQRSQMMEVREYAFLLMKMQFEDIVFRVNKTAEVVEASPNTDTVAVYRAVVNAANGDVLWRSAEAVPLRPDTLTSLYAGEYVSDIASCDATFVTITENGKLYTFCGLYKAFGSGPVEGFVAVGSEGSREVLATWVYERVPPTYVILDSTAYRVRRVVAPDTYLYLYATPQGKATLAVGEDKDLVGLLWRNYSSKVWFNQSVVTVQNPERIFDWDDSTYAYFNFPNGLTAGQVLVRVDLGSVKEGFLYFKSPTSVVVTAVSNDSVTWVQLPHQFGSTTLTTWRVRARYVGLVARLGGSYTSYQAFSFEFYPVEVWMDRLSFPVTQYREPVLRTVTLFAQSGVSVQLIEVTRIPR